MNNTTYSSEVPDDMGGESLVNFGYGIGLFVGVIIIFLIITSVSFICSRVGVPSTNLSSSATATATDSDSVAIQTPQGIDEATLLNYPKFLYSDIVKADSAASGCSICLADYKAADMLRLLPDCGHQFHVKCIDPWLMLNATCPICRNSPLPTPLAEVAPLASTQN